MVERKKTGLAKARKRVCHILPPFASSLTHHLFFSTPGSSVDECAMYDAILPAV